MRIALLYLGRKGAGPVYSLELARALLAQGVEILAIISAYSENLQAWQMLERQNAKNGLLKLVPIKTYQTAFQFVWNTLNPCRYGKILYSIKKFHPDAVFATMFHPWHVILFSLMKNQYCRIKVIHDVIPHPGEDSKLRKIVAKWDILSCDKMIVLSQNSKKELLSLGIAADRVTVIPHAHFGVYNQYLVPKFEDRLKYRIGFFGRINKYKGVDILLAAYKKVKNKIPDLKLLIAGSGEMDFPDWDGLELHNKWIEDKDVVNLVQTVDFIVLPYVSASQSGVIPLVFSIGKPVIATNVGGLPEQVPSNCGIVVNPHDVESISNAILYFYEHPSKIKEMGQAAYRYAYGTLTWDNSARLFISIVDNKR